MLKSRLLGAVGIVAVVGVVLAAQAPTPPAFEVASVKANKSGSLQENLSPELAGGRFTATNVPLMDLIWVGYGTLISRDRVVSGPSWINSDRFDIVAKGEGEPTDAQMALMVRALLAERFKLAAHIESRELPVFALVIARSDGRIGPTLVRSNVECATVQPTSNNQRPTCGMRQGPGGKLTAGAVPVASLVEILGPFVDRPIQDRTGLTGAFDIDLIWTPDRAPQRQAGSSDPPPADPNGTSIFTAVQEQLGLKLESSKGPVDVLVIDHVERPTED